MNLSLYFHSDPDSVPFRTGKDGRCLLLSWVGHVVMDSPPNHRDNMWCWVDVQCRMSFLFLFYASFDCVTWDKNLSANFLTSISIVQETSLMWHRNTSKCRLQFECSSQHHLHHFELSWKKMTISNKTRLSPNQMKLSIKDMQDLTRENALEKKTNF